MCRTSVITYDTCCHTIALPETSRRLRMIQALKPLLAVLDAEDAGEARAAAKLLGTVLAKRPAIADFLVGEGALPTVANLVATGALQTPAG